MNAKKHKNVFFVLSAFAFALVIMSRPNMAVLAVLIVPVLIKYFFRSGNTLKQNALSLISFAVPLMIGAAAVCAYNYLRFDSIFEFGAKYQLTVYDVSKYTFSASLVVPCLYHYFVQFPKITGEFPFINLQYVNLHMHTTEYLYNTSTVGALAFLSNFGAFGIGGILAKPKAHREQKWTYSVAFLSVLLLAYINTCLGGVNIRYFADFAMVMIMFSSLILLEIPSFFKDSRKLVRALVQIIISVLFICSAALGFLLIFENERNYILKAVLG